MTHPDYIFVARPGQTDSFSTLASRFAELHPEMQIEFGSCKNKTKIAPVGKVVIVVIQQITGKAFADFAGEWTFEPLCPAGAKSGQQELRCGDVIVVDSVSSVELEGDFTFLTFTSSETHEFPLHRGLRRAHYFNDTAGTPAMGCATTTDAYRRLQIAQEATDQPRILRCHLVYMWGSRYHWHRQQTELYVVHDRQAHGLTDSRPQSLWTYRDAKHLDEPHRTLLFPGDVVLIPAPVIHRGGGLEPTDQGGTFDMAGVQDGGTLASVIAVPEFQKEFFVDGVLSREYANSPFSRFRAAEQPA